LYQLICKEGGHEAKLKKARGYSERAIIPAVGCLRKKAMASKGNGCTDKCLDRDFFDFTYATVDTIYAQRFAD
jgi:hypothetical protein